MPDTNVTLFESHRRVSREMSNCSECRYRFSLQVRQEQVTIENCH